MEQKTTLLIGYGALCDPIQDQLKEQGFNFDSKKVEQFEQSREALLTLRFGPVDCPDSIYDKLLRRLHSKVTAHIKHKNKPKL